MAADTRQRIVEESLKLFGRNGYAGTSVADIERAAGLKPGAGGLYAHFDSKADVLAAAIEQSAALADVGYSNAGALPRGDLRAELTPLARGSFVLFGPSKELVRMAPQGGLQFAA